MMDGVHPVTLSAAVKIEFSVLFAVIVVHGRSVGIAVIPQNRQNAPGLPVQDCDALLLRQLLLFSKHRSEQGNHLRSICRRVY